MRLKHLTDNQYEALRARLDKGISGREPALYILFSILAETGMRCEELSNVRCVDLMPELKALHVKGAKRSENRTLALSNSTYGALDAAIALTGLDPTEHVVGILNTAYRRVEYPSVRHAVKQRLRALWRDLRRKLYGVTAGHLGLHCLRHTVAIRVLEHTNKDLLKTRIVLGHKSLNSTMRYVDYLSSQDVREDCLAAMRPKKTG